MMHYGSVVAFEYCFRNHKRLVEVLPFALRTPKYGQLSNY